MKKRTGLSLFIIIMGFTGFAQQLPLNTCGIVNVYDATGNRTQRVYFCNNGTDPYPAKVKQPETKTAESYEVVDALYPNPTTGRFFITFSKALNNAFVLLTDANGKVIQQFKGNGYKIEVDLSAVAAGIYFVQINDAGNIITKKVVKQ